MSTTTIFRAVIATFAVSIAAHRCSAQDATEFVGDWVGTLHAGQQEIGIVFHLSTDADGMLSGSMDVPTQGGFGSPIESVTLDNASITLILPLPGGASFSGTLIAADDLIEGTFSQGTTSLPLKLARADNAETPRRPQEPTPPFPYLAEDVTFVGGDAGVTLAGTVTTPRGTGPFPGVVLISGSGPHDRDSSMMGHKPFLVLADHLTREGIAVLRFDDRGTAQSGGDHASATPEDFASDALAALSFLSNRRNIADGKVGLIGHSEGALAAIIAVDRSDTVAFLITLVGGALPGSESIRATTAAMGRINGAPEMVIAVNNQIYAALSGALAEVKKSETAIPLMRKTARELFSTLDPAMLAASGMNMTVIDQMIRQFDRPNTRFVMSYDPRPALRRLNIPTLAVLGSRDPISPSQVHAPAFAEAFAVSPGTDEIVKTLPGLNHLLQEAETGSPAEFGRITQTMSPVAMRLISTWIIERFGDR